MKIGSIPGVGLGNYKNTKIHPAKTEVTSLTPDTLEISESSRLFSQALKVAMETPVDRVDKIASLKGQIADGSYSVNSMAVADRMLNGVIGPEG